MSGPPRKQQLSRLLPTVASTLLPEPVSTKSSISEILYSILVFLFEKRATCSVTTSPSSTAPSSPMPSYTSIIMLCPSTAYARQLHRSSSYSVSSTGSTIQLTSWANIGPTKLSGHYSDRYCSTPVILPNYSRKTSDPSTYLIVIRCLFVTYFTTCSIRLKLSNWWGVTAFRTHVHTHMTRLYVNPYFNQLWVRIFEASDLCTFSDTSEAPRTAHKME